MGQTGISLDKVKKTNRAYILKTINNEGPISKKDIALKLGLTAASLTQTCAPMLDEGIIYELGTSGASSGPGRKKVLLDINYDYQNVYCVVIEPENTTIAITNLKGDSRAEKAIRTKKDIPAEDYLKEIADICRQLKKEALPDGEISLAGVCISGPVDREKGTSVHAYGIWDKEIEIGRILEEELGVKAIVENNVTAFALAEIYFGHGKKNENLFFVKWGPGLGAAIVTDGRIYEGQLKRAAEIGHFIVQRNGQLCSCGRRGCLETKLSFSAVKSDIDKIFSKESTPRLFKLLDGNLDNLGMEFPDEYFENYDEALTGIIGQRIAIFAQVIINCITILSPDKVVLCGPLFKNSFLREKVIEGCSYYDSSCNEENIIHTALADKEAYIGAAALCAREALFGQSVNQ